MSQNPDPKQSPTPYNEHGPAGPGPDDLDLPGTTERPGSPAGKQSHGSRTGALWMATTASIVLLVLLIIFILQNSGRVSIVFFGLEGSVPIGMALLIAAVGGAAVVAIAGIARMARMRISARRSRRQQS
ncbi:lipopolysaccharide assembly protein LapA domain-containing protein [Arthrobacter sp. H14]|uniref:lipopolysaccharide assembly protein LapA domain-containing protein n=1 Tax=Arthrobacter sp. H14 TaxID=1312959 RepID=UPI0004B36F7A|nr:lipopolysaccharide assembly protein LapA domain-containing protein [Arthrobacter sp. H14]